jgi:hypothetical protein
VHWDDQGAGICDCYETDIVPIHGIDERGTERGKWLGDVLLVVVMIMVGIAGFLIGRYL